MAMYKLRNVAFQQNGDSIKGLTCPNEIASFFENTNFFVVRSGTSIVYTSGTKQVISKKQLEVYNYEDCLIK